MSRITRRSIVAVISVVFLLTAVSGLVLWVPGWFLPAFGISLLDWRAIHEWSAVALTATVVVHVALNGRRIGELFFRRARPAGPPQAAPPTAAPTPAEPPPASQALAPAAPADETEGLDERSAPPVPERRLGFTRRRFLVVAAGALAAVVAALTLDRGGSGIGGSGGGLANFPVLNVESGPPHVAAADWVVAVDGLVENKLHLDRTAWLALPRTQETRDFHCVEGWSVGHLGWEGVRVADLLSQAQPQAQGQFITFYAYTGVYSDSLTLAEARAAETLLADSLDGKPLPPDHGGPLRLVIPSQLGYKNVKWVVRLEVTATRAQGYWEENGYPAEAPVG